MIYDNTHIKDPQSLRILFGGFGFVSTKQATFQSFRRQKFSIQSQIFLE